LELLQLPDERRVDPVDVRIPIPGGFEEVENLPDRDGAGGEIEGPGVRLSFRPSIQAMRKLSSREI